VKPLPPTEALHPDADRLQGTARVLKAMHREDLVAVRAVGKILPELARLADEVADRLGTGGRLFYVGAGTSGRLGALDAAEWPPTFGTPPHLGQAIIAGGPRALLRSIEEVEADAKAGARAVAHVKPSDLVCGITAGGTTPFVLGALKEARRRGAATALVTCNPAAPARVDFVIALKTGPEVVAGSTRLKAGTATKLVLNAISTAAMFRLGRVVRGRMLHVQPLNPKLRARLKRIRADLKLRPRPNSK
jgi:N-acetylmuramic acid 6-phosphate etherase